nr:YsnF/AvaK domain-containing protein [Streptomyces kaniharaensis]
MNGRPANGAGEPRQPDLDFGTTPAAVPAKPLASRSPDPAPKPEPTATAKEADVRTPNTSAPAAAAAATTPPAAAPTVEPKPQAAAPTTTTLPDAAPSVEPKPRAAAAPAAGPGSSAPSGPVEITCREERLDITTEWRVLGTAKLRKYVTSEQVERRVPVVRERARVERMPVTEAERAALTEKDVAEAVEEVTLREERPVVRKYLAPVERVRLVVERYTTEEVIRDELRREHVEVHDNTPPAPSSAHDTSRPASVKPLP